MSRAGTPTLLSLNRYAQVMGFDPLYFAGGHSPTTHPRPRNDDTIFFQYDWQDADKVSREQLAILINEAEHDIADQLGYWPCPVWIADERHLYPRARMPGLKWTGGDALGRYRALQLNFGYLQTPGIRRETELAESDSITLIDVDRDTFDETAEIIFTLTAAQASNLSSSLCEVKLYFKEYDIVDMGTRTDSDSVGADPTWEIRPINASLVGTTLTIRTKAWNIFCPYLWEGLNVAPIDADVIASYADVLVAYTVDTDPSKQVEFVWGDSTVCEDPACGYTFQNGCMQYRDVRLGFVVPQPATYDSVAKAFTTASGWLQCLEPDFVRVWYYGGYVPKRWNKDTCHKLDSYWAKTVAILATARSDWEICSETSSMHLVSNRWRQDLTEITDVRSFTVNEAVLGNPFGTRFGEVEAWKRVRHRGFGRSVDV